MSDVFEAEMSERARAYQLWRDGLIAQVRSAIDLLEEAALGPVEKDWRVDGANSCQVYVRRDDDSTRTIAWCGNGYEDDFANVIHIAYFDPAAVLRQVAGYRKMLARIELVLTAAHDEIGADGVLVSVPIARRHARAMLVDLAEGLGVAVGDRFKETYGFDRNEGTSV